MKRFFTGLFGFTMALASFIFVGWLAAHIVDNMTMHSLVIKIILFFTLMTVFAAIIGFLFGNLDKLLRKKASR